MRRQAQEKRRGAGLFATAALFVLVLAVLLAGTLGLSAGASERGAEATREAIERAAVLCYATEGFYPPGLSYIEEHYNVKVNRDKYVVWYDVFAYNVRPSIRVEIKGG